MQIARGLRVQKAPAHGPALARAPTLTPITTQIENEMDEESMELARVARRTLPFFP